MPWWFRLLHKLWEEVDDQGFHGKQGSTHDPYVRFYGRPDNGPDAGSDIVSLSRGHVDGDNSCDAHDADEEAEKEDKHKAELLLAGKVECMDRRQGQQQRNEVQANVHAGNGIPIVPSTHAMARELWLPELSSWGAEERAAEDSPACYGQEDQQDCAAAESNRATAEDAQILNHDGCFGNVDNKNPQVVVSDNEFHDGRGWHVLVICADTVVDLNTYHSSHRAR